MPATYRCTAANARCCFSHAPRVSRPQGVGGVGAQAEQDEHGAKHEGLRHDTAAMGINELRQKGQEEERHLGIERLDHNALRVEATQRGALGRDRLHK